MKYLFVVLSALCFAAPRAYAQILNGGFENWVGIQLEHWHGQGIKQTSESHSGNFSVSWNLESSAINLLLDNNARVQLAHSDGKSLGGSKIPLGTFRFTFWYKAKFSRPQDNFIATIAISSNGIPGIWFAETFGTVDSWTKAILSIPISHTDSTIEDSMAITFSCGNYGDINLDDVSLEPIPSIVPGDFQNVSLYVNPSSIFSLAHLHYHLNSTSSIHASILDLTGREVMKLPSVPSASGDGVIPFDCDGLPNGMYYLRFEAGGNILMRKIIVQH